MTTTTVECGSALLLSLPDDVLALVTSYLLPSDLSSLLLSCRRLHSAISSSEKVWLSQCLNHLPSPPLLSSWRSLLPSYYSLCRFLSSLSPLIGVWVHQNPELGNVVSVLWGSSSTTVSVIACRIIPQELCPAGLDNGPLLWVPVFEILPSPDARHLLFFLHGRDPHGHDSLYPGSLLSVHPNSNVLLLEVDARKGGEDLHNQQQQQQQQQFSKLAFGDRRRLLDLVTSNVPFRVSAELENVSLFPNCLEEELLLGERTSALIQMHKVSGGGRVCWRDSEFTGWVDQSRFNSNGDGVPCNSSNSNGKKRSFFSIVKQIIGRSSSLNSNGGPMGGSESKHLALNEFLRAGDTVGLTLRGTNMRLTTYRAWPNMHDNRFALYKLPLQKPVPGKEYTGLWGGTFGWPPGKTAVDKSGKALFFLLLSYEEVDGHLLLIATKILEGTHYVLHPNGSAMFIVKVDEHALESFPWETDGDGVQVEVKHSYYGEGIANGYGFRYPGSKPGSLFEICNGHLAFVWKESKTVLTLQRLNLEDLLKKGERVPALPPVANFAYLTKSYSNVFAGPNSSSSSASPRYYSEEWLREAPNRLAPHRDVEISEERNKCLKRYFPDPVERRVVINVFTKFSGASHAFSSFDSLNDTAHLDAKG